MLGTDSRFDLIEITRHPDQRKRLNAIRMMIARGFRSPIPQDLTDELMLVFDRSDKEVSFCPKSPGRTRDVMNI